MMATLHKFACPALFYVSLFLSCWSYYAKWLQFVYKQMAGRWEGFSEEDIQFYLNKTGTDNNDTTTSGREISNFGRARKVRKEKLLGTTSTEESTPIIGDLPEAALLIKPRTAASDPLTHYSSNGHTLVVDAVPHNETDSNNDDTLKETLTEENLERFHARQKLLEEQNRQRKEYLAKLLSDRKKQTTEEARRLQTIQEELHKLDLLLSDDVSILRNQIETAAKDFGDAQKRFNKAEKEFMDAKQLLFAKMERKELLTKHLCTIIEQNELRKAHKLSELMEKLAAPECNLKPDDKECKLIATVAAAPDTATTRTVEHTTTTAP